MIAFTKNLRSCMTAALLLTLSSAGATAKTETKEISKLLTFESWKVKCYEENNKNCVMTQRGIDKKSQKPAYRFTLRNIKLKKEIRTVVDSQVPLGVALPYGVVLSIDIKRAEGAKQFKLNYSRCTRQGCSAGALLTPEMDDYLRNGRDATISYKVDNGKVIKHKLSLKGGAKALEIVVPSGTTEKTKKR